ncbi:hypothetical protein ACJJID_04720 [Microbulbifer sp. CnH-101-G]|uniref:hypothetical protein n=1 Tax=Microbulbifer sp. CnH-101-G TaxID=3243393 RepID=UPI0040397613
MDKPQQCAMASRSILFKVEGRDIAVVDSESLKFSKLEINGEDVRYNRKGEEKFKLGSFPKIDEDGNYAFVDIILEDGPFGFISSSKIDGSVDILTSKGTNKEVKNNIDLKKAFTWKVGSLEVSNQSFNKSESADSFESALKEGLKSAFLGDTGDNLAIYVTGNLDSLVELKAYENGSELNSGWSTTSQNEKAQRFDKPNGSVIDIELTYWDGLERVTVPITL